MILGSVRKSLAIGLALLCGGLFAQTCTAEPIRIMPFGDDWTNGRFGQTTYRYPLWFMLQDAGFDVDFVGRRMSSWEAPNLDWYPDYHTTFDRAHEGRHHMPSTQMLDFAESGAEMFEPHVVLLMIGSRDIFDFGESGISLARNNVPEIIQAFRDHVPNVVILLASPPPWIATPNGDTTNSEFAAPLANAIAQLAVDEDTPESPVYLVNNFNGFNTNTMLGPEQLIQPNLTGEGWMAGNFFEVLEDVLPTIEVDENTFSINAGLNDAWFNPDTPGQGFFLTVFPDIGKIFLAWFTYDTERPDSDIEAVLGEPGHRWLTAFGDYTGNVAQLEVELTSSGVFNSALPAPQQHVGYGEILIEFQDCNSAVLTYDLIDPGLTGLIEVQRIANDNIAACEALNQAVSD